MRNRLLLRLAPFVLVAACVAAPAVAQATEPHWYIGTTPIPEGKKVTTKTGGILTFNETFTGTSVTCTVADTEVIENPVGGAAGIDTMKAFKVTKCTPPPCPTTKSGTVRPLVVTALGLPWASKLVGSAPIADEITGIELKFQCKGSVASTTYTGTLLPWVGTEVLEFNSPTTGMLGTLGVNGIDKILAPPGVSAHNP
ncbi:MAG: hypothetical protein ACLQBB_09650 [Solirubrobacteraceae bacterium]